MFAFIGSRTPNDKGGTFNGVGKGVYSLRFDAGLETSPAVVDIVELPDPAWLALARSKDVLYAASHSVRFEGSAGAGITALRIQSDGTLRRLNSVRIPHAHVTLIAMDPNETFLLAASSGGGAVSMIPITSSGRLEAVSDFVQFEGEIKVPVGQMPEPKPRGPYGFTLTLADNPTILGSTMPHSAEVTADGKWALVADLGANAIMILGLDVQARKFTSVEKMVLDRPAGPRLIVLHPNSHTVYSVNQLDSTVSVYEFSTSSGSIREIQHLPSHSLERGGESQASGILLDSKLRYLWTLNRVQDSISTFIVEGDGRLRYVDSISAHGVYPMHIQQSPDGRHLVVANVFTRHLDVFSIDEAGVPHYATSIDCPGIFTLFWPGTSAPTADGSDHQMPGTG